MTDTQRLLAEYLPLVDAELVRIGFTEDDFRYFGSGGERSREELEAYLAGLRLIPAGIGANAYFARYGIDFAALQRDAARWGSLPAPGGDS